jgi:O-antigen/teichoic acid export membrane protein
VKFSIQSLAGRLGVNKAISYTVVGHFIAAIATPITTWLVLKYLTLEEQGYFYTFGSLLAIQSLFELGFGQCISQFAAHEFAQLKLDENEKITGEKRPLSRFITLVHYAARFYIITAVIAYISLVVIGCIFFNDVDEEKIGWRYAWYLLCASTALNLLLIGATAVLQGCNQVAWVARARTISNIIRPLVLASCLFLGFKLYSVGAAAMASLGCLAIFVWWRWSRAIKSIIKQPCEKNTISWWNEVWPFQWRIAVSWAGAYLAFSLFNPIIFKLCGSEVAGRFGVTWSLLQNVSIVASVWNGTSIPTYCAFISRREWGALDRLWKKNSIVSFAICAIGCLVVLSLEIGFSVIQSPYANRMLDSISCLWLIAAFLINNIILSLTVYLRAHKHDPLMWHAVISGIMISVSLYFSAKYSDIRGISIANFFVTFIGFIIAVKIFFKHRYSTRFA